MKAGSLVASISIIRGTIGNAGRWPRDWTADLAGLARLTIREAYQHQWSDRLKSLCGWRDDGGRMLRLALRSPEEGPPSAGTGFWTRTACGANTTRKPASGFAGSNAYALAHPRNRH